MLTRASFEESLRSLAQAPAGVAASDGSLLQTLQDAITRLDKTPSLFSGDPQGIFTYEDPILAVAALYCRSGLEAQVGTAAPGEELTNRAVLRWALTGIRAWLSRGDEAFITLSGRVPTGPITFDNETVRIAILGDAGYCGQAQNNVLRLIRERHNDKPFNFLVHLGDTYFAGSEQEMLKHFLDPFAPFWHAGIKVMTLCGNHDLYYGPTGYSAALRILGQPGRYFVIDTPHWKIACLDTALGAERLLRDDGKLDAGQLDWLDGILRSGEGKQCILMSHHFILSSWEDPSPSLSHQLRERAKSKVFAWYWGHEHCCATYHYDPHGFYGACVGNGAFLDKWEPPSLLKQEQPDWYAKGRCECYSSDGQHFWPHGYLDLELTRDQLIENYYLEGGEVYTRILKR
jgi:hypothetical protein